MEAVPKDPPMDKIPEETVSQDKDTISSDKDVIFSDKDSISLDKDPRDTQNTDATELVATEVILNRFSRP